jgi:cytidylate kinase
MTVITLSRQFGSQGEEIAAQVAHTLDLRLIDAETINRAAQKAGVPQMALAEMEHGRERSVTNQVLNALRTMPSLSQASEAGATSTDAPGFRIPFAGLFSTTIPPISASLDGYVRMVDLVIQGLAREGNVLILGRGGQMLLRNYPAALHIQIVAPQPYRIELVMKRHEMDRRAAQNRVRASDRARFDYVRRYHDADWLDPTLYHLTINTARVPPATAVDLIIAAQQTMVKSLD